MKWWRLEDDQFPYLRLLLHHLPQVLMQLPSLWTSVSLKFRSYASSQSHFELFILTSPLKTLLNLNKPSTEWPLIKLSYQLLFHIPTHSKSLTQLPIQNPQVIGLYSHTSHHMKSAHLMMIPITMTHLNLLSLFLYEDQHGSKHQGCSHWRHFLIHWPDYWQEWGLFYMCKQLLWHV